MSDRIVPRHPPSSGIADRLADRLLDPADQVRRLDPPGRTDPERFWRDKSDLAGPLDGLARDAGRVLGEAVDRRR